ncbi:hypothetical protein [Prauserella cavernicola]|uniref:Uncharacterized protein n=1 Tax=Prauserella cavernicola TaxID=2800127 RepID=A0A934QM19_9PSEU|nr:hypothetical protein [Prauserella cavernicola]MBK1784102.1 hypothetical protein [Prauserella cavernicola]
MNERETLERTPSLSEWSVPPEGDEVEYGVFSLQSGCLVVGIYSREEALQAATEWRDRGEVTAYGAELCREHESHPREECDLFAGFDETA